MERPPRFAEEKIKFFNKYQPYYQLTNTFYCGSACRKTDQGLKSAPTLIKLQKADSLLDKKGKNIFLPSYQGN